MREADFNLVIPRGAGRMMENSTAGRVSERTKPAVDVLKERRIVKVTEVPTRNTVTLKAEFTACVKITLRKPSD